MLSDKLKSTKITKPRKPGDVNKSYSDSQKLEAVKLWLTTGNLVATAAALNIKFPTIRQWRYSNWWSELAEQIRTEGSFKMTHKLKQAAEKALEVTVDRLENGDWIYDQKSGELRRKPVSLRDANTATSMLLDKAMKIEQRPHDEAAQHKVQDRLEALAKAFGEFASKARRVEVIDAVQIRAADEVDVCEQTEDSEEMGEAYEVYQITSQESTEG